MKRPSVSPRLDVLMAGPSVDVVGGMSTVTATLAAEFDAHPLYRLSLIDSGGGRGPAGYWRFVSAVHRVAVGRYDVLHLHVASRGSTLRKAVLALCAKLRSIPYVIHLHGAGYISFLSTLNPAVLSLVRRFYLGADGIIVLGDAWRDSVVGLLGIAPERITVVHNGVRRLTRIPDSAKRVPRRVVFVGEVSRRKGADLLTLAWSTLVERGRAVDWECVCLGPMPESDIVAGVEAMPAAARSTFHLKGALIGEEKNLVVSHSSIFCLPSRAEGLPMALLEAMSAGVPGVCSEVGAIGEVLDEANGRLISPGDAAALAAALDELMNDEEARSKLGDGAFRTWSTRFTAREMAHKIGAAWSAAAGDRA